jgi:F-box and WD-40 domain protein CDC4
VPTTGKGKGRGRMNLIQALTPGWRGNDDRKRAHQTLEAFEQTPGSPSTSRQREDLGARAYPSPPRKKIRSTQKPTAGAPLSPLPSPELESPPPPASIPLGPGYELATLYSLPTMMTHFDGLPDQLQQHVLTHMLRRSRMPTIQRIANFASSAIRRDLIGCLPRELSVQILKYVDAKTLARSTRVCKKWRHIIDGDRSVWKEKLIEDQLYCGKGVEEDEEAVVEARFRVLDEMPSRSLLMKTAATSRANSTTRITEIPHILPSDRSVPLKHVYRRRYQTQDNWFNQRPVHNSFPGQGTTVVTCLQFDREKIVSASDDQSINVYSTSTGRLRKKLEGHEGGVWALQYRGDTLVTGSTDRSVRVWDLRTLQHTHTFTGHTSTVRCLQIVEPVLDEKTGKYYPSYPVIVTGSRDHSLRVWKLPMRGEPAVHKWASSS